MIRNSPENKEGIVYKVPCSCGKFYVGQSGKHLEKRLSQHRYYISRDDPSSAINMHTRLCHQPIRWNDAEEIYKRADYTERNIIETACIYYSKTNNINNHDGLYKLDALFLHIFKHQYKINQVLGIA